MSREPIVISNEAVRKRVMDLIAALDLSKPWAITVAPHRKRRTTSQNALYWKWIETTVGIVARETGNDRDDMHLFFKQKFLTPRVFQINGQTVTEYSTKTLTTGEMADYMNRIYAWVTSELGLLLPVPEDRRDAA